ncbi:MAG: hypothetical protein AAFQ64_00195 [Pseudomonadota bacterium]
MRIFSRLGSISAIALTLAAPQALADIKGPDVWAAYVAYYEATGAQVIGTPETAGGVTEVVDPTLLYRFPFGFATIRVVLPTVTFTDQSDGTVAMSYPATFDVTVEADVPDQGSGTGIFTVTQDNYVGSAAGDPDAVVISYAADGLQLGLKELTFPDSDDLSFQGQILSEGYGGTSTIAIGEDFVTVTGDTVARPADLAYVMEFPSGDLMTQTGEYGQAAYQTEMSLPKGGTSLFALSKALTDGAFVRVTSQIDSNSSNAVTTIGGQVLSDQTTNTGSSVTEFSVSADGLHVASEVGESSFDVLMPDMIPVPIEGVLAAATATYTFPLLPRDTAQNIVLKLGLTDLTLSEDLWAMFDPAAEMPRDPASLNIDIIGSVVSEIDWLDFANLEAQLDQPVPPITPEEITINDLSISAVGASAQGSGAFTLDLTDLETFDGFPRPEGAANLAVSGANALLDRLTNLGLIGPDEAGMARLGMGFIARSTGADSFETAVEVNAEGQVFVNGQRMR